MSVTCKHNAGFFSCCSVKLDNIVNYINLNSKIPSSVDSSLQFKSYNPHKRDITYEYFEHYNNITDISINYSINYNSGNNHIDYSKLDYNKITPVVKKYFSPSKQIINMIESIKQKYNINYDNTIAVYYRGTDKASETKIATFADFYSKVKEISKLAPKKQIIIQTDTSQFLDYINNENKNNEHNIIILNENSTSYSNRGIHKEKTNKENYNDMLSLFAIVLILSKCKYIICGSGNVSLWIMLYRENNKNVYQFLNGKWLISC